MIATFPNAVYQWLAEVVALGLWLQGELISEKVLGSVISQVNSLWKYWGIAIAAHHTMLHKTLYHIGLPKIIL